MPQRPTNKQKCKLGQNIGGGENSFGPQEYMGADSISWPLLDYWGGTCLRVSQSTLFSHPILVNIIQPAYEYDEDVGDLMLG
jgi:hypothetical protein